LFIQVGFRIRRSGIRLCPYCAEMKSCLEILINYPDSDWSSDLIICPDCIDNQGREYSLDIPHRDKSISRDRKKISKKVRKEEQCTAREIGGIRTRASGSLDGDGDCKNNRWMVEEKSTKFKTFSIRDDIVSKAIQQASKQGKDFVMKIRTRSHTLGVMLWNDILELVREE
jgi:glutaredoxin